MVQLDIVEFLPMSQELWSTWSEISSRKISSGFDIWSDDCAAAWYACLAGSSRSNVSCAGEFNEPLGLPQW